MNDLLHTDADVTPNGPEELQGLKHKHVSTHGELNELEHANIVQGMRWLDNLPQLPPLDEEFLRELHRRLFAEVWHWAGRFRRSEMNIGIDPITIPVELRLLIDNTNYWIEHHTYEPLEIALRFHHRLLQIHPFSNGNGRLARISTNTLLKIIKSPPIDWSGGRPPEQMEVHRKNYIAALRSADAHDLEPLLIFVGVRQ